MKSIIIAIVCLLFVQNVQAFDQEAAFAKLYKSLALTGNQMPLGESDIPIIDESYTDFVKQLINLNELSTDVVYCSWGDLGLPELTLGKPESDNQIVLGMYRRLEFNILKCNEFLDNTTDSDAETIVQRAEARFLRALYYSFAIDLWGDMPLWKTAADKPATRSSRQEVFDFITEELKSCADDMRQPNDSEYGRANRVAAWLLLSRLYLNAEVYTGTAQWQQAKEYAQKVIDSSCQLCDHYSYLFMGDNHSNGAQHEVVLPVVVDGLTQYSYGNTTYLIAATHSSDMPDCGLSQLWAGYYARKNLLDKFFIVNDAPQATTEEMILSAQDDRCLLYGLFRSWGNALSDNFYAGFSIDKFSNKCVNGTASSPSFADTDFPLLRVAEAYLNYAEADARQNGGTCTSDGLEKLNVLRQRAHASTMEVATLFELADEWCREFYLEGRRRMDLIRFGFYTGDEYLWEGKGSLEELTVLEGYRCLMPIPDEVLTESPQFTQNFGYSDPNFVPDELVLNTPAFGSDIVDLQAIDAMRLSWQRPSNLPEGMKTDIHLELSLAPDFLEVIKSFVPKDFAYEVLVDALDLNRLLQLYDDHSFELPSIIVYARCVSKGVVSNTVELNVKSYDNSYELLPQPWYFVGEGIGDGSWNNSAYGLGASMFPLNISYGYNHDAFYTGYFHSGDRFKIVGKPGSWDMVFSSYDGTRNNLIYDSGYETININEDGWYHFDILFDEKIAYCSKANDLGWQLYNSMVIASGDDGNTLTDMIPCSSDNAHNHMWYARVTFESDDSLQFLLNGNPEDRVGAGGFPYAYAEFDKKIPVQAGSYVVFFDDMSEFYLFDDATTGEVASPRRISTAPKLPVSDVGTIFLADATAETLKVCDFDVPQDADITNINLLVGNFCFVMNANGEVNKWEFVTVMNTLFGEQGRHSMKAQVAMKCDGRDLIYSLVSDPFTLTVQMNPIDVEQYYYYIGSQTGWDSSNLSMPMTCLSGDWATAPRFYIDINVAAGYEDYFNIFPASATSSDDFWGNLIRPQGNDGTASSGTFAKGNDGNVWMIPSDNQDKTYRLTLDFITGTYTLEPVVLPATSISAVQDKPMPSRLEIYDLQGRRVNNAKKGIYIINNHKKIVK